MQLHSTAAYYPERPTPEEQGLARSLIQSVAAFYPCGYCRKDFAASVQTDPPKCVGVRVGFGRAWYALC